MAIVEQVRAKVVVPAHYRTERIDFIEPVDGFAERFATVHRAAAEAAHTPARARATGPRGDCGGGHPRGAAGGGGAGAGAAGGAVAPRRLRLRPDRLRPPEP